VALAVQDDVHPLVEERHEVANLRRVVQRLLLAPGEVRDHLVADGAFSAPVGGV
jgi:hypothetical protein